MSITNEAQLRIVDSSAGIRANMTDEQLAYSNDNDATRHIKVGNAINRVADTFYVGATSAEIDATSGVATLKTIKAADGVENDDVATVGQLAPSGFENRVYTSDGAGSWKRTSVDIIEEGYDVTMSTSDHLYLKTDGNINLCIDSNGDNPGDTLKFRAGLSQAVMMDCSSTGVIKLPLVDQVANTPEAKEVVTSEYLDSKLARKEVLLEGIHNVTPNANKTPTNEGVTYSADVVAGYVLNEFSHNADDGFLIVKGINGNIDTSKPMTLTLTYYVKGTSTGDLQYDITVDHVTNGYIYNQGGAPTSTHTITDTMSSSQENVRRQVSVDLPIVGLVAGEAINISVERNGASNSSDTLASNIVHTHMELEGWVQG